jgi:hypothetical protein
MDTGRDATRDGSGPVGGARFAWRSFALWLPACLALGVSVAWAAVVAQDYFAPLIIFPLLVGVGLGAILVGLMRLGQVGNRPTVLLGAALAVAASVLGQHYIQYWSECRRVERQVDQFRPVPLEYSQLFRDYGPKPPANFVAYLRAQAAIGRDMKIHGYVARGRVAWLSWAIDGLLVLLATLAMVVPAMRLPFCNHCRSWHRVTRSGRIDAWMAGRLAELIDLRAVGPLTSARYRLLNCIGGCGPTGFELSWQQSRGSAFSVQAWLDAECRDQITRVLDEAKNGQ